MTESQTALAALELNWKITGRAGEGVMTVSETIARVCHRHGMYVFNYYEYPSLIKGGHQTGQVFASFTHASCQKRHLDLLVALDENGIKLHQSEITSDTIIICEPGVDGFDIQKYTHLTPHIFSIDLTKISRELTGHSIATNTAALGTSAYFLGLDKQFFHQILTDQFVHKGQEVVSGNIAVFEEAFHQAASFGQPKTTIPKQAAKGILLNAGEAIGMGALSNGLQFFSAYPMSPSSNTFHYIASAQEHYPLVVRHVEDEIAAINVAIGASFAGVRSMTGTAGGGFALMVEAMSLTGVMETPLVILVAMRPGPATGLPTWTSQGDLLFVINAGHGEFQKVVLTPGTVEEHFHLTRLAFDLAEKYQIPVIIQSDKYILESQQSMSIIPSEYQLSRHSMATSLPEDDSYRRYTVTDDGISPRSIPGQPHGLQLTNSYEHDEFGFATEDAEMTIKQVEKRQRKMDTIAQQLPQPILIGPEVADLTLVCWGSTLSVLKQLLAEYPQLPINLIHIPCIWPFPAESFTLMAQTAKKLIMVEGNHTGQAERLIKQQTGITFVDRIRRYDGRPFYVEDIVEYLEQQREKTHA